MKWFCRTTKYECEVLPRARVLLLKTLDSSNGDLISKALIVRTPIRRWRKYINPWNFGHDKGWCRYVFAIVWKRGKLLYRGHWEPLKEQ